MIKKYIYKKSAQYKKFFFRYSINMSNPQQNKILIKIEQFKREINLLQDKLEKSKRKQGLLQNGQKRIAKMKNGPKKIGKMHNKIQNETKQIKRKIYCNIDLSN